MFASSVLKTDPRKVYSSVGRIPVGVTAAYLHGDLKMRVGETKMIGIGNVTASI